MSKTKTAAAFALGFIVGSSRWLWVSVLLSGVLHAVVTLRPTFAIDNAMAFAVGAAGLVTTLVVGVCAFGCYSDNTGPK